MAPSAVHDDTTTILPPTTTPPKHPTPPTKSSPSPLLHRATTYLNSYKDLSPTSLTSHFTPSFTHTVLPASLSLPPRSLPEFSTHASKMFALFRSFAMIPTCMYEDAGNQTVVAHCRMGGEVGVEGLGLREWWNECVLFIEMEGEGEEEGGGIGLRGGEGDGVSEGGEVKGVGEEGGREVKIRAIREFVDSAKAEELRGRLMGTGGKGTLESR